MHQHEKNTHTVITATNNPSSSVINKIKVLCSIHIKVKSKWATLLTALLQEVTQGSRLLPYVTPRSVTLDFW